jgi:predicted small lipoprotein YifL
MRTSLTIVLGALALAGCGRKAPEPVRQTAEPAVTVRGNEQDQLRRLDAFNLAIGLKRAIFDSGYSCRRVTDAGFVGTYKNLDMWMARCSDGKQTRDWAVFAGADGSAQVRDCKDVGTVGLPQCVIKQRPKGTVARPQ